MALTTLEEYKILVLNAEKEYCAELVDKAAYDLKSFYKKLDYEVWLLVKLVKIVIEYSSDEDSVLTTDEMNLVRDTINDITTGNLFIDFNSI